MPTLLDTAHAYIDAGLSILPVLARTKKPTVEWTPLKSTPLTKEQASRLFPAADGLALICGSNSGNLLCLDFDARAHFLPRFEALAEEALPGIGAKVVRQKTQNGGQHWVFRVDDARRATRKLAYKRILVPDGIAGATYLWDGSKPEEPPHLRPETSREKGIKAKLGHDGQVYVCPLMIETRGESVDEKGPHPAYFLAAPTPRYTLIQGTFLQLPVLSGEEADKLMELAASLDEAQDLAGEEPSWGDARAKVREGEILPGDVVNELSSVAAILEAHGGTVGPTSVQKGVTTRPWTRPGKDASQGLSGTIYADAILHNFTSSVPELPVDQNFDAFGLIVRLDYDGNFGEAVKRLQEEGLKEEYAKDGVWHAIDCTPSDEHLAALQDTLMRALHEIEDPSGSGASTVLGEYFRRVANSILRDGQRELILKAAKDLTKISVSTLRKELRKREKENKTASGVDELSSHVVFADATIASFGEGNLLHSGGEFYYWKKENGVWRVVEPAFIAKKAQAIMKKLKPEVVTGPAVESVVKLIKNATRVEESQFNQHPNYVNCLNGTLVLDEDTGDWSFKRHERDDFLTVQLPVKYDSEAEAPRTLQFLKETFAGEPDAKAKAQVILQFLGYTLVPTAKFEMFFIATGAAGSGKSRVAGIVQDLLGKQNYVAVMPEQFGNKFQRAQLHGKLANIITELPEGHILPDGDFKNTISGEPVTAEHKGQTPFTFNPFCSLWICTNHLPHTRDYSGGIFRRAILLRFNNVVPDDKKDVNLSRKLKEELSGILNLALAGYSQVIRQGRFTIPASTVEEIDNWRINTNQVEQFLQYQCEADPEAKTPVKDLYAAYREWIKQEGIKNPVTKRGFVERLRMGRCECRPGAKNVVFLYGYRLLPFEGSGVTAVDLEGVEE